MANQIARVRVDYVADVRDLPNSFLYRVEYCADGDCVATVVPTLEQRIDERTVGMIFAELGSSLRARLAPYFPIRQWELKPASESIVKALLMGNYSGEDAGGSVAWNEEEWHRYSKSNSSTKRFAIMDVMGGSLGQSEFSYAMTFLAETGELLLTEHIKISE